MKEEKSLQNIYFTAIQIKGNSLASRQRLIKLIWAQTLCISFKLCSPQFIFHKIKFVLLFI